MSTPLLSYYVGISYIYVAYIISVGINYISYGKPNTGSSEPTWRLVNGRPNLDGNEVREPETVTWTSSEDGSWQRMATPKTDEFSFTRRYFSSFRGTPKFFPPPNVIRLKICPPKANRAWMNHDGHVFRFLSGSPGKVVETEQRYRPISFKTKILISCCYCMHDYEAKRTTTSLLLY